MSAISELKASIKKSILLNGLEEFKSITTDRIIWQYAQVERKLKQIEDAKKSNDPSDMYFLEDFLDDEIGKLAGMIERKINPEQKKEVMPEDLTFEQIEANRNKEIDFNEKSNQGFLDAEEDLKMMSGYECGFVEKSGFGKKTFLWNETEVKNSRNAGRKPLPVNEKMVKYGGGLVPIEMLEWIKNNGGIESVRAAIDFYRQHHTRIQLDR